jgi:hypothetical protein
MLPAFNWSGLRARQPLCGVVSAWRKLFAQN